MRLRKKDMADLMELWGEDLTNGKKTFIYPCISVYSTKASRAGRMER